MELYFTLISFAALAVLALFAAGVLRVPSGTAPLLAVCFTMLHFSLWGCVGLLGLGGWLYFALAAAALVCLLVHKSRAPLGGLGMGLFLVGGVLLIILFAVRQPLYLTWDEFSFWGTAVKMTKLNNELYTTAKIGWAWVASQKPGLVVLGYMFEFFGKYAEWRALAAFDMVALASIAALVAPLSRKKWYIGVPAACVAFLSPYVFTLYYPVTTPSNVYMNILSDVPMAWLFAGALAVYYALRMAKAPLWPCCVVLAALTLTRDTALPLALIAAGIMSADMLLCGKDAAFLWLHGVRAKWCRIGTFMAAPAASFVAWVLYLKLALNVNAVSDIGGQQPMGMLEMLVSGVKQLVGIAPTEKFTQLMGEMYTAFFTIKLTMLGSGAVVSIIILGIVALAALFAADKVHRVRCILYGVLSSLGFFAFYIFTGFCYVFIFKDVEIQSGGLVGYERYLYPYYIGWFLCAVMLLCITAAKPARRLYGAAQGALFMLLAVLIWRVSAYVPPDMTFVGYDNGYQYGRRQMKETAQQVQQLIPAQEDTSVFFIRQGDDGSSWFMYCGELLPLQMDYSFGGGTLALPGALAADTLYYIPLTPQQLCAYLAENGCDYIFVLQSDTYLVSGYGSLFSDGLAACEDGAAVYKINGTAQDMAFTLVSEVDA